MTGYEIWTIREGKIRGFMEGSVDLTKPWPKKTAMREFKNKYRGATNARGDSYAVVKVTHKVVAK